MTKEQLLVDVLNTALNDGYLNSTQHTELTAHVESLQYAKDQNTRNMDQWRDLITVCKTADIDWCAADENTGCKSMTATLTVLVTDATRYRLGRMIATEPDATIRDRMLAACDGLDVLQFIDAAAPTNEHYDAFMDAMIAAANGARNADG
jgi:hypothetical protein